MSNLPKGLMFSNAKKITRRTKVLKRLVESAGPKACQQCPTGTAANSYGQTKCEECNFGYRTYSQRFLDAINGAAGDADSGGAGFSFL